MLYLVKGNAQQIFSAFGRSDLIEPSDATRTRDVDIPRSEFMGTEEEANLYYNAWCPPDVAQNYTQGNMTAGILQCLFGSTPLKKDEDTDEQYMSNYARLHFAYVDDNNQPCGLMLIYRRDDPTQWVLGFSRNAHLVLQKREIMLLSSVDLKSKMKSESKLYVPSLPFMNNPLMENLRSQTVSSFLQHALSETQGVNLNVERLHFVTRHLHVHEDQVTLNEPIDFSSIDFSLLFADNPLLDLLMEYRLYESAFLSSAMLANCLSEPSELANEINKIPFGNNFQLNRNLLRMTIAYYENETLNDYRDLLADTDFIIKYGANMWNKEQVHVLAFMYRKQYHDKDIRFILAEPVYFKTVNRLAQMGLTQDVLSLLQKPEKLNELEFINNIINEDIKRLCLIFWVKGSLTLDGYRAIIREAKKYPLMAATLIHLDQQNTVVNWIGGLETKAMTPKEHLCESIEYYFGVCNADKLNKWSEADLHAASIALTTLSRTGIKAIEYYHWVMELSAEGKALRLFLSQISNIKEIASRQAMIEVLYRGLYRVTEFENAVAEIKDPQQKILGNEFSKRFVCVRLMQELAFSDEKVTWAAQEGNRKAERYRDIIMHVENQCKLIVKRLESSNSYLPIKNAWGKAEENYRKELYRIAYDVLESRPDQVKAKLEQAKNEIKTLEENLLKIVNPSIDSGLYKLMVVIANVVISALTLFAANCYNLYKNGDFWFFTKSASGTDLCQVNKLVIKSLNTEDDEEASSLCSPPLS
jgi:hypothetical protein